MDIFSLIFEMMGHRVGAGVLGFLSGGRFKGESGYAWGIAVVVGGLILLAPFVAFIAWLLYAKR